MKTEISCSAAPSGLVADIASYFKHSQVSLPLTEKTYEFSKSLFLFFRDNENQQQAQV